MTKHTSIQFLVCLLLIAPAVAGAVPTSNLPSLPTVNDPTLSLSKALDWTHTNNLALLRVRAAADAADADASKAKAQTQPNLSAITYGTVGNAANVFGSAPGVDPHNVVRVPANGFADQNLMLMFPLSTGGRLRSGAIAAQEQGQASTQDVQAAVLSVTQAVTLDYVNAALQQALVAVAQSRLTAENEQVRITQEKVNTGRLAPVDLLREQAEQADAEQNLLASQNDAALALVMLKTDMGVSQESHIGISETLATLAARVPSVPYSLPAALNLADTQRPELAATQQRVSAAESQADAARGESRPQIYGVAMGDAMTGQPMNLSSLGYSAGVVASLPILDGGARRADVRSARAQVQEAEVAAAQTRQTVDQQTASAWLSLQTATAQMTAALTGVSAAQESSTLADLRYNAGKSVDAERLDALAALTRAQGTLAQSQAALIAARANLLAAMGGGNGYPLENASTPSP
jgi:outer membrane protein TolC